MKKTIYFILLSIFVLSACNVSKKKLAKGDYDAAVKKSVKKLQRNSRNEKEIVILEQAYPLALQKDIERINYLNIAARPDRWVEIYNIYVNMKDRQQLVSTVTPVSTKGRTIEFKYVNYDKEIVEARNNAADYYYRQGKELMRKDTRLDYREAYGYLYDAMLYNPSISDIDVLMETCKNLGTTYAILIAVNKTIFKLPNDFMSNLISQQIGDMNSNWVQYYNKDSRNGNYDVNIFVVLRVADVSGNNISENSFQMSKEIKDGWEYLLDESGNVLTDSLGNKIKVAKYKSIFCNVIETTQYKTAHIDVDIEYEDVYTKQLIRKFSLVVDHRFDHTYTNANGDLNALDEKTKRNLRVRPVPYPSDMDMLWGANETIKNVIGNSLWDNRRVLESW